MTLSEADFKAVCELVLKRSGIVLEAGKEYLVEARLTTLAKKLGVVSAAALVTKLRAKDLVTERAVIDAMTTNETSFFRDHKPFETLKRSVIPALMARRAKEKRLSLWCAASSTGQEPYTIAMQLLESFPQLSEWKFSFVASDLSRDVLEKARSGRYSQVEVNRGLPAPFLVKYFRKDGLEWEVQPQLRKMIDFREVNLLSAWPALGMLDVVFIRNVLIYFSTETKREILGRIRGLMRSDGYLFLGAAETTLNVDDKFQRLPDDQSGCYQIVPTMPVAVAA